MEKLYTQMRQLTLLLFLSLSVTSLTAQCSYTLNLYDSWGDGWNGASLVVSINGEDASYTIDNGSAATFSFEVNTDDNISATFNSGSFDGEITYEIINHLGEEVFSDGPNPVIGLAYEAVANCAGCVRPSNITPLIVGGNYANFSFDLPDDAASVTVNYGVNGDLSSEMIVEDTIVMIDELMENTMYQLVMSTTCTDGVASSTTDTVSFMTGYTTDVGIGEVLPLESGSCALGLEKVRFNLVGYGSDPQTLFGYNFSVNGEEVEVSFPDDGFFTGVVGLGDTIEVEFDAEYDFSTPGAYDVAVWITLPGDSVSSNDTARLTIVSDLTVSEFDYSATFTEDTDNWKTSGMNTSWVFESPEGGAQTGTNAWLQNRGDSLYNNNEDSYLESPCFDFSSVEDESVMAIGFYMNYITEEGYDGFWLEASKDGGVTWEALGTAGSGDNWYNSRLVFDQDIETWSGFLGQWVYAEHSLDGFQGEANCKFRFHFRSDGSVNRSGVMIDDITIFLPPANDLGLLSLDKEGAEDCGDGMDYLRVDIRNLGQLPQTGDNINVYYQIGDQEPVMETLPDTITIEPLSSISYTLTNPVDFSTAGAYEVTSWVALDLDTNMANDSASISFDFPVISLPVAVDFEEDELPEFWTGDGFITDEHGAPSLCFSDNLYSGDLYLDLLTGTTAAIGEGSMLSFDYRYVDYGGENPATTLGEGDVLYVGITSDCGASYDTVYTVNSDNHTPTTDYTNIELDLSAYEGMKIKVLFRAEWATGDYYLDLDNINISGCPASFSTGIEVTDAIDDEEGAVVLTPTGGFAPYTYSLDNLDSLAAGDYEVTITDANGCTDQVAFTVEAVVISSNNEIENITAYKLFPNPSADVLNLNVDFNSAVDAQITIMNTIGQTVRSEKLSNTRSIDKTFNVENWSAGTYFIHILVDGKRHTRSFMKQ